jgi:hypothetical protein
MTRSRTMHVAYDESGKILAIAEEGIDLPVAGEGVIVTMISVPTGFVDLEVDELEHLYIDVTNQEPVESRKANSALAAAASGRLVPLPSAWHSPSRLVGTIWSRTPALSR